MTVYARLARSGHRMYLTARLIEAPGSAAQCGDVCEPGSGDVAKIAGSPAGDPARPRRAGQVGHASHSCHTGNVNSEAVARGKDGKLYPVQPRDDAGLRRIRGLVHAMHCRDGLTVRGTKDALLAYGVRRSVGAIHDDLHRWSCGLPRCPSVPTEPDIQPAAQQERPAATVRSWGGSA